MLASSGIAWWHSVFLNWKVEIQLLRKQVSPWSSVLCSSTKFSVEFKESTIGARKESCVVMVTVLN